MLYVIRNCPAYRTECEEIFNFLGSEKIFNACLKSAGISCKDITDCLLKRIADICKAEKDKGFVMTRYGTKEPVSQGYDLACRILKEMEIEECENE